MTLEHRLLETIARNDGQLDYYGLSVGKGFSAPADFNQLYDVLKRMKADGCVKSIENTQGHFVYSITPKGRTLLTEALDEATVAV